MNRRASTQSLNGLATLVIVASLLLSAGSVTAKELSSSQVNSPVSVAEQAQGQPTAVAQVTYDGVLLEQNGTQIELQLNEMPDDAIVAGIDLKVSVAGAPVTGLQAQLAAPDGTLVEVPLQPVPADQGNSAKRAPDGAGTQVSIARTAITFHQLDGQPGLGAWTARLIPADAALVGKAASISLVVQYTTSTAWPVTSEGSGGHPAMRSLPAPIWELSTPATEDRDQKPAAPSSGTESPNAWQTIKYENFEGSFPNSGWTVLDQSNDGYQRFWDDDDYKPYGGNWSAWPARGGANGVDPQFFYYPNNMNTWMVYGPFNLSNATDALTVFRLWREIEPNYDYLYFGVSANGTNFTGVAWSGIQGWTEYTANYPSFVGDSSVWVGWQFYSDSSNFDDGPFVDNISIQKNVPVNCGPFAETGGWDIPDDGSWLAVPLADRMAPAAGTVSDANVKYIFDHPDPSQLEVKLAKAGSAVEQTLWSRGELVAGDKLGSALGLTAFNGQAAQGDWQLMVRDLVPGQQGRLAAASVRARYTPTGPVPTVVKGPAGKVSALSLPPDARRITAPDNEKPASSLPDAAPAQPDAWQIIKNESFEGTFPNAGWTVTDLSNDGCDFLWDDDDFKPHTGNYAAWPANGGANALDPAVSNYPPNMNSWMVYGPFSLAGATDADTLFALWRQIESSYDAVGFGVSADGTNFNVVAWDGAASWTDLQVNYQSYTGDATVWVAWIFQSDGSNQYDGPWVDDIAIRKFVPVNCGPFAETGGWVIPDDGSWLSVPLADRMAPAAGTVGEANVKYLFDHPDPSQLEVKLAKAGSAVEQTLWSRGELVAGDKLGSALGLTAFNGQAAQGDWQLMVRDLVPGQQGRLAAASVRARYAPTGPVPTVVKGPAGEVSALSLPADARRTSTPDSEKSASSLPDAAPAQPNAWQVIKTEGFENEFPNTGWTVADLSSDGCDFLWDDDTAKPLVGNWAAWPANGGSNALNPAVSNYPPNMNSWMVYGPFSLADATDADTLFALWRQIEPSFDWVGFGVSADGVTFNTVQWTGTTDWTEMQVNYQSYVDDPTVWVAWIFHSDATVQLDGPWIDQIVIRRFNPPLRFWVPMMLRRAFQ